LRPSGPRREVGTSRSKELTERDRYWLRHQRACDRSGLSAKAYARKHRLSIHALYQARRRLREVLDALCQRFDWVLLDSPPLASVTDALLLARQADTTVMVVQHNKADRKLVRRAITSLRRAGADLLGAVLNVVDLSRGHGHEYYYYQQDVEARSEQPVASPEEAPSHA